MDGVELTTAELAYLLATVNASQLIGVDDASLFPDKPAGQKTVYGRGREQLEANGWLKAVPDHVEEYELDSRLLELVAVIGAPELVVATSQGPNGKRRLVLHYIQGESIAEVAATAKDRYQVGYVADRDTLHLRIAEMLNLTDPATAAPFRLSDATFKKLIVHAQAGEVAKAEALLEAEGVDSRAAGGLSKSVSSGIGGELVLVRPAEGEIAAGRRATLYGEQSGAWLVSRPEADSKELELMPLGQAELGQLVDSWADELTGTP